MAREMLFIPEIFFIPENRRQANGHSTSLYTEISGRAAAKDMMLSAKKIFINCEKSVEEKS